MEYSLAFYITDALGVGTSFVRRGKFYIKDKQSESWQPRWLFSVPGVGKGPAQYLGVHQGGK